jgi:hypothetical protein
MTKSHSVSLAGLALLLAVVACGGQQDEAEQGGELPPVEEMVAAEPAAQAEPAGVGEEAVPMGGEYAEPAAETAGSEGKLQAAEGVAKPPATVAPAPGVEQPVMKNWMLIEFAKSVEPEDLRWLEKNGFRVDTVMSAKMVRGWLEEMAGGEAIAKDPRIVKIHPQMR